MLWNINIPYQFTWWQYVFYGKLLFTQVLETTGKKRGYFSTFFSYLQVSLDLDLGTDIASLKDTSDYIIPLIDAMLLSAK